MKARLFADFEFSRDLAICYFTIGTRISRMHKCVVSERGEPLRFRDKAKRDTKLRELRKQQS